MKRHEFEVFDGASGMACTALVTDDKGYGVDCGQISDAEIHQPRYDADSQFWLREADPWPSDEVPIRAYFCRDCGSVVVDQAFHDQHHDRIDSLVSGITLLTLHSTWDPR